MDSYKSNDPLLTPFLIGKDNDDDCYDFKFKVTDFFSHACKGMPAHVPAHTPLPGLNKSSQLTQNEKL